MCVNSLEVKQSQVFSEMNVTFHIETELCVEQKLRLVTYRKHFIKHFIPGISPQCSNTLESSYSPTGCKRDPDLRYNNYNNRHSLCPGGSSWGLETRERACHSQGYSSHSISCEGEYALKNVHQITVYTYLYTTGVLTSDIL